MIKRLIQTFLIQLGLVTINQHQEEGFSQGFNNNNQHHQNQHRQMMMNPTNDFLDRLALQPGVSGLAPINHFRRQDNHLSNPNNSNTHVCDDDK